NHAPNKGMHFGYPYCHQGDTPDPEFGSKKNCSEFTAPAINMMPHAAALGMRFYTGNMFSAEYRDRIFIAEHGSWNRSQKSGYRVMMVSLKNNKAVDYVPFATGWVSSSGKTIGRPVDIEIAPDGALLVSDDDRGAIYRIAYKK
ncbi:MAG TPA: PQQ-dependent sugar dehydrogenase, partial [Ferruginibacter sp.]|nr:PQQ-dependent sugar dehydrogenase [Ferruginibacter sp.]